MSPRERGFNSQKNFQGPVYCSALQINKILQKVHSRERVLAFQKEPLFYKIICVRTPYSLYHPDLFFEYYFSYKKLLIFNFSRRHVV